MDGNLLSLTDFVGKCLHACLLGQLSGLTVPARCRVKVALVTHLASLPGSPLALTKNKNRGEEPGIDSHVISWHDAIALTIK